MTFVVNGLNMMPYIAFGGLQWQRSDIDGEGAGRNLSGNIIRDRIAIKIRWDVTCKLISAEVLSKILQAIEPEFVPVQYTNPVTNRVASDMFYSNNFPAAFALKRPNGVEYWSGLTFPLIQR